MPRRHSSLERFGPYELVERLGAGGMGEVFLAHATDAPKPVVLKRVLPHLLANARFLRLFLDETRIAARLDHPNIARIYEIGEVSGAWYLTMEYVQGLDWRDALKRARKAELALPLPETLFIAHQVAKALEYAHAQRDEKGKKLSIVHRDVSPHNVLVSRQGDVKLIDFGVAKATNKTVHTVAGMLKGKFPYMAPEQAVGHAVDARTDLFALGILLWESLAGMFLFRGKSDAATLKLVRACEVPPLDGYRDDLPKSVTRLVHKLLQKNALDRYQTATALIDALEPILAGLPAPDVPALVRQLEGLKKDREDELDDAADTAITDPDHSSPSTVDEAPSKEGPPVRVRRPVIHDESSISRVKRVLAELALRPTNLTPATTSFVGRVAELADLHQLFRHDARVITLVGSAGTGKTRLAQQFASQLVSTFKARADAGSSQRGGVWFVDLSTARDVDGICAQLAAALAVPLATDAVEQLKLVLAARKDVLVVFDNCEQVVDSMPNTLGAWLEAAPRLRVVATSREPLKLQNETVFEVPPLRLPERGGATAEAVQLFHERARAARPDFQPTAEDEVLIAQAVKALDGLPLAIELAAARMSALTPAQLVQRLQRRFEVLGRSSKAPTRQSTLRAAIDWSWQALSSQERLVLAQCAVFRGGFSPHAAGTIIEAEEVASVLDHLRLKSLVRLYYPFGDESFVRYGLLESIREYALEKLVASPQYDVARERHAQYYLELGGRIAPDAEGSAQLLDTLELERDNLDAVYQRAIEEGGQGPRALNVMLSLDPLLTLRGPFTAHLTLLEAAVARVGADQHALALGLEALGRVKQARGRVAEAADDFAQLRRVALQLGDRGLEGRAAAYLGTIERLKGQRPIAKTHFERALELLREASDRKMEARTLSNYAVLLHELSAEHEATDAYMQALDIHREVGDRRYEGITLANLGVLQQAQGLLGPARDNYQDALTIHRELGNRRSEGISHINLADLHRDRGEEGAARSHYVSALAILREVGARRFEGVALVSFAALHQERGDWASARELYREGIAVLESVKDRRYLGLATAALAAIDAAEGATGAATQGFRVAAVMLDEVGDASFLHALELYRAHLELQHPEAVQQCLQRAERAGPAVPRYPGGSPSPADRSEHVRSAARSLRRALERQ